MEKRIYHGNCGHEMRPTVYKKNLNYRCACGFAVSANRIDAAAMAYGNLNGRSMPIKTRLRPKRVSLRRSFRTRPSDQTAIICVDHHPEIKLFYEDEWDDDFALRSPKPRRERRPKHNPVLEEDIIEEEEENVNDNDENNENVDPQVDSDLPAMQELNEKIAIAEEWSLYIESEEGERMKAVGNKLVPYETYTGHKATAHLFPKREKTPPPSEEEVKALDRARCDSYWAHVDRFLGPVKKKTPVRPTIIMASGTSFRAESAAIERVRKNTRSLAIEPIEETPEMLDTESASVGGASYQQRCSEASTAVHSVTPKSRLQSTDGRKQKPSLLTASLLDLDDNTQAESRTCQELSFTSICDLGELQSPVLFSTPVQSAPQAQSTPFDQAKEIFTETPVQRTDFSSPRWANVTGRSKERTLSRLSRKSHADDEPISPPPQVDSFDEFGSCIIPDNPASTGVVKETEAIKCASNEDEQLSYMLETSLDLSLHNRSEHQMSYTSMATLGEELPLRTTQNIGNMTRNATQMSNTTRNITHLTNASFVDIPFYLSGCENAMTASPLQTLLYVIGQPEVIEWNDLPKDVFENPRKLGEGVYGEVFATTYNGRPTAMKVVPFHGDKVIYAGKVNGECLMDAASILPEILTNRELSALNEPISDSSTPNFIQLLKVNVVRGQYPEAFLRAWDQYDEERESENDRPTDYASNEQLFVTIGMAMGGIDLEHYKMKNEDQVLSTLLQVAISLLVAEDRLEFEHRDLHIGNVLVIEEDADLEYKVRGGTMILRSYGVKVNIIDFTLSRMRKEGTTLYRDLEADEELFTGSGDYQFDIYRMMRHENQGDWLSFNPKTNCFWLHYLSKYLISKQKCRKAIPKKRKQVLQSVWDQLLNFDSVRDMFTNNEFIEVLKNHLTVIPRSE
ncbi:unnamed protein product [Cylicocyclus nassatus]|uniref:non-specific serine/threonine protein kinase n=1 Tax=Cylicocyclus nassatus TaxID=53992 RepID=A0AA36GR60_CYLNA|nr:unnamed protein product [Cylicocyclus nassatus]